MVTEASRERLRLAKSVSLIGLIKELGYPMEDTSNYYRMLSPFRSESQPSFDINKRDVNKWHDRGTGHCGDIIDFVQELFTLNKKEAINYLLEKNKLSIPVYESVKRDHKSIEILHAGGIISPNLIDYLSERRICLKIAETWLKELTIRFPYGKYPDRKTQVLGFKNDDGGYEMRNKFLKLCNSPKTVTTIKGNNHTITNVYEGFFSFLSHYQDMNSISPIYDCVILNSLSFLPQMISFWGQDRSIDGYLDNDTAGDKATKLLESSIERFIDQRESYKGYNDLNDKLCGNEIPKKKSLFFPKY